MSPIFRTSIIAVVEKILLSLYPSNPSIVFLSHVPTIFAYRLLIPLYLPKCKFMKPDALRCPRLFCVAVI